MHYMEIWRGLCALVTPTDATRDGAAAMEPPEEHTQRDAPLRQHLGPCLPPCDDPVRPQAWMAGEQEAQDSHAASSSRPMLI
jgi:hypothetical protein